MGIKPCSIEQGKHDGHRCGAADKEHYNGDGDQHQGPLLLVLQQGLQPPPLWDRWHWSGSWFERSPWELQLFDNCPILVDDQGVQGGEEHDGGDSAQDLEDHHVGLEHISVRHITVH